MNTVLNVPKADTPRSKVQLLPCRIQYTGPAPVSTYLVETPTVGKQTEGKVDFVQAAFRGRLLVGRDTPLPEGYTGIVYTEERQGEGERRVWGAVGTFQEVRMWGHDCPLDVHMDPMARSMGWPVLADAMMKEPPVGWIEEE